MLNFLNWQYYVMLNVAIMLAYMVIRTIQKTRVIQSPTQQLLLARFLLTSILVLFLLMPLLLPLLQLSKINMFALGPMSKTWMVMENSHVMLPNISPSSLSTQNFSILFYLKIIFFSCLALTVLHSFKSIRSLWQLTTQSFCLHHYKNIRILMSEHIPSACCWSLLNQHFILLPLLSNDKNLTQLALQHESQHIRQGDTWCQQFLTLLKIIFYLNPFIYYWINYIRQLQEFACDEALIKNSTTKEMDYAECLLQAATVGMEPTYALSLHNNSYQLLQERITMIFHYKKLPRRTLATALAYGLTFSCAFTSAYALNAHAAQITESTLQRWVNSHNQQSAITINITPELLTEMNNIQASSQASQYMQASLKRMENYKAEFSAALNKNHLPMDLLALPLAESGYQNLNGKDNSANAAGVWQFVPQTAKNYGLKIATSQDERLNPSLETTAAISYLKDLHNQFHDWNLALIAYEIGEKQLAELIHKIGSQDPWVIARSPLAPPEVKQFLLQFDASVLFIKHPQFA